MRINQYLAAGTSLSRRAADAAVQAGQVQLNGQQATLGQEVGAGDEVRLDGQLVTPRATFTYVMLHKPAGYVCSRTRQGADPTVYTLLPPDCQVLRLAGRLDRDSSGLVVLSDDGDFIYELTHPSAEKSKRYEITLESPLKPADAAQLAAGVKLSDGPSRVEIESVAGPRVNLRLHEGRNRQLRRTFGALGYTVLRLHRTHIGPFALGKLPSGAWAKTNRAGAVL